MSLTYDGAVQYHLCADRAEPADVSIIVRDGSPEPACTVKVALTIQ